MFAFQKINKILWVQTRMKLAAHASAYYYYYYYYYHYHHHHHRHQQQQQQHMISDSLFSVTAGYGMTGVQFLAENGITVPTLVSI